MRRIYFLVPNLETTHKIVDELRAEGFEDRQVTLLRCLVQIVKHSEDIRALSRLQQALTGSE